MKDYSLCPCTIATTARRLLHPTCTQHTQVRAYPLRKVLACSCPRKDRQPGNKRRLPSISHSIPPSLTQPRAGRHEGFSMTSSGSGSSSSTRSSLVLSFVAGAASVSSLLYLFLHHHRQRQQRLQQPQQKQRGQSSSSSSSSSSSLPPSLEHELFARVLSFFGEASFPPIQQAFIVVVGLGGVGSHAAQMLVRSGVKRIRVVDFDQVKTEKWKKSHGKR